MQNIINEKNIDNILSKTKKPSGKVILAILKKARNKKGLSLEDVGYLANCYDEKLVKKLFETAKWVKEKIYGERIVFFAPLYVSDFCVNDCSYCNFHAKNKNLERKKLSLQEIEEQVKYLIDMGHKRILLECGEDPTKNTIDYVVSVINKIYSVKTPKGNIRRINVNIAATTVENYRKLKKANIGTYQLFQETYHRKTYEKLHKGPKSEYQRQITAHLRAFKAGIDDLGVGVLFGLYDWKFEVLALISHAQYMDKKLGVGPHTISVPRFCPASGVVYRPQYAVSDKDFLKIIAILRLAVPYTGIILSTRERPQMRKSAFAVGVSQASAASVTSVGGYGKTQQYSQFNVSDERPLKKIIESIVEDKLLPSFCTACYRLGRTGHDFMDMAKPGDIQRFCKPNGLLTFAEYLEDFCNPGNVYKKGYDLIRYYLNRIKDKKLRSETQKKIESIKQGKRDLYF